MKKQRDVIVFGVVFLAAFWSATSLMSGAIDDSPTEKQLAGAYHALARLEGRTEECDCDDCTNDSTKITYECLHTAWPPSPGTAPSPANGWTGTACSSTYCIKNTDYFAKCPTMAGGADCPWHDDPNQWFLKQEVKNNAPADCNTPDYSIVDVHEECKGLFGDAACVVGSCGGTLVPPTWYYMYRGGDPNDANNPGARTVCD